MQRFMFALAAVVGMWPVAGAADPNLVGRVVRIPEFPDLYYVAADGKRYAFPFYDYPPPEIPDFDTHATWYPDRSEVITISRAELETYAIGGNVTMRPGIKLVGLASDFRVYVVMARGWLREISESQLLVLYGPSWRVHFVYIPEFYFINYQVELDPDGVFPRQYLFHAHPPGTLFRYPDNAQIYLLDRGTARPFTAAGLAANGFRAEDVVMTSRDFSYPTGFPIENREERLTTPAGPMQMFSRNDVDGDGEHTLTDAIQMFIALFRGGPQPQCQDAADANDDGTFNLSDPIYVLRLLFQGNWGRPYPSPTNKDFDPTGDRITCVCYRCDRAHVEIAGFPMVNGPVTRGPQTEIGRFHAVVWHAGTTAVGRLTLTVGLKFDPALAASIDSVTNISLVGEDGRMYGGSNLLRDSGRGPGYAFGGILFSPLRLPPGVLQVRADLADRLPAGVTMQVALDPISPVVRGQAVVGPSTARSALLTVVDNR